MSFSLKHKTMQGGHIPATVFGALDLRTSLGAASEDCFSVALLGMWGLAW